MTGDPLPIRRRVSPHGARAWRVLTVALAVALMACGDGGRDSDELARTTDEALANEMVTSGASARRVADYELTTENIERWFAADAALASLAQEQPAVASRLAEQSVRRRDRDPIRRAVAHLASVPEAREALDEAGMTPYDFVLTGLALHQALLAAGPGSSPTLRRLAARNAAFVERHGEILARYAERRPRYVARGEPEPVDSMSLVDSLGGLDTLAMDSLAPDSGYGLDTLDTVPATLPVTIDTVGPRPMVPALPPTVPEPPVVPAPSRPAAPPPGSTPAPILPPPPSAR